MKRETKRQIIRIIGILFLVGVAAWIASPKHPTIQAGLFSRTLDYKLGLDLQGGAHLIYKANVDESAQEDPTEALAGVRDIIERRVNVFGVSEPVIQTNRVGDEYRVIVELAGVFDTEEAIQNIGETPQLDFRREIDPDAALNIDSSDGNIVGPLFEKTELTGKHLQRSTVDFDQVSGTPQVNLEFNSEGADLFAQITRDNIGSRIAIYLDGVPISAPVVNAEITNGRAVITGGFALDEAKALARRLNAGALPVPIELIGQQTVGPTLGEASLQKSLIAGIAGIIAVMVWMTLYYRLPGFVASVALAIYVILFIALIKLIPITLTLAGIAGLIMSVGMAVDANVLIFERFRENLRANASLMYAFDSGFKEAWSSIWASNISSLITGVVLYGFGTSIVRGFALTFSLGIMLSMFTAIVITKTFLRLTIANKAAQRPWLLGVKNSSL